MYIWFIDSENKVSTFNTVHFPNYEISASLSLALPSNKHFTFSKFNKRRGRLLEEIRYLKNKKSF